MKKLFVVLLALAVVGMVVFADAGISLGGWGRSVYTISNNGTDTLVGGMGWAGGARVGVTFAGNSDNVGFVWNPGYEGGTFNVACDQAKIWVKVNPMLKFELGKAQGDVLRGKIGDPGDVLSSGTGNEDTIFTRFQPQKGLLIDVTPIDGLFIGAALDSDGATQDIKVEDAFKAIQIGAGYTIEGIGLLRAQYIGQTLDSSIPFRKAVDKTQKIQAAFAYTGMAGLTVDAGVTIPGDTDAKQMGVSVGADYGKDALSVHGRVDAYLGSTGGAFNAGAYAQTYYKLADPLSAGLEIGFGGMKATSAGTDAKYVDLFPAVKLGYSNGYLKVGFEAKVGLDGQDLTYQVPLQLEYWF